MNATARLYDAIKDFPEIAYRPDPANTKNLTPCRSQPAGESMQSTCISAVKHSPAGQLLQIQKN
jgi:hypothetical protein